jgi:hypothetical protein
MRDSLTTLLGRTMRFMEGAKTCRKVTRDLVLALDFRALQALSTTYQQDFNKFETIISYEWVNRHKGMFANLRFLVLDGMRLNEEVSDDLSSPNIPQPLEPFQPLVLSYRGLYVDATSIFSPLAKRKVMYLDISYTCRPDSWSRLMRGARFENLRVLKMNGMRLTDRMFPDNLLTQSDLQLWSLDLRDNLLTDAFVFKILSESGIAQFSRALHPNEKPPYTADDTFMYRNAPLYTRNDGEVINPPYNTLVAMRNDTVDGFSEYLRANGNMETDPFHAIPKDDIYLRPTGLTHLYLSNNKFTCMALNKLLRIENSRLQVLDIGSLQVPPNDPYFNSLRLPYSTSFAVTNTAKYFALSTGIRVEKLRIHHSFVTLAPTVVPSSLQEGYRLDILRSAETLFELEARKWGKAFRPQDNYCIRELTLTDIPTMSYGPTIRRLINFLMLCYEQEVNINRARRSPQQKHYRAAPLLSGLRVLRLEFLQPRPESAVGSGSGIGGSIPCDADMDAYIASSKGDFSFFAEEKKASSIGMYNRDIVSQPQFQLTPTNTGESEQSVGVEKEKGKWVWQRAGDESEKVQLQDRGSLEEEVLKDVIEELKKFRRIRPRWGGELQILRPKRSWAIGTMY